MIETTLRFYWIKKWEIKSCTWIGAELNDAGERSVALVVPGLDFDKIGRVGCQTFNGGCHFIANDTFNYPITIALRTVRRVKDNVTWQFQVKPHVRNFTLPKLTLRGKKLENFLTSYLSVGLFGWLPIQVDCRGIFFDRDDRQIPRWWRRSRLECGVWHNQTPRTLSPVLKIDTKTNHIGTGYYLANDGEISIKTVLPWWLWRQIQTECLASSRPAYSLGLLSWRIGSAGCWTCDLTCIWRRSNANRWPSTKTNKINDRLINTDVAPMCAIEERKWNTD